eukprot:s1798_g12.t1
MFFPGMGIIVQAPRSAPWLAFRGMASRCLISMACKECSVPIPGAGLYNCAELFDGSKRQKRRVFLWQLIFWGQVLQIEAKSMADLQVDLYRSVDLRVPATTSHQVRCILGRISVHEVCCEM